MKNYLDAKLTFEEVMTGRKPKKNLRQKFMNIIRCLWPLGIVVFIAGCGLFKSDRRDIPPAAPTLNYKQDEAIKEQAEANYELASILNEKGAQPNSEETITLRDGSKVILKYVGVPFKDIDLKDVRSIIKKADGVVTDHNIALAKHDDKLDKFRESIIHETNQKWDLGKIFGFGITTWILVLIGVPVLCAFFPVLIPVFSLIWQLCKAGFGAFRVVASLGVSGVVNIVKAVERFRDAHKGTEIGQAFDTHMSKTLDHPDQVALDKFKNHFNI